MYIDFHAHILPDADHGSESLEMSLSQLRYAARAGVDTIVATPHFYPTDETVADFLERREKAYSLLEQNNDTGIKIIKGAEVQIAIGIEKIPDLDLLCIGDTRCILLEFPKEPWPYWFADSVKEIARERRLRPIIAHIDRYSHIGRDIILSLNSDVQINASAMLEGRKPRRMYLDLISDDYIHILGSDVHGSGKHSYKEYATAVKRIGDLMPYMTANARKILSSGNQNK